MPKTEHTHIQNTQIPGQNTRDIQVHFNSNLESKV